MLHREMIQFERISEMCWKRVFALDSSLVSRARVPKTIKFNSTPLQVRTLNHGDI